MVPFVHYCVFCWDLGCQSPMLELGSLIFVFGGMMAMDGILFLLGSRSPADVVENRLKFCMEMLLSRGLRFHRAIVQRLLIQEMKWECVVRVEGLRGSIGSILL